MKYIKRLLLIACVLFVIGFSQFVHPQSANAACGGRIYVSLAGSGADGCSWLTAFPSLQTAITTAGSGDEIWVAAGTYKPGTLRTDTFTLKSGVKIYGGFSGTETLLSQRNFDPATNNTILSGEIGTAANTDNINTIVTINSGGVSATYVLDGFTITRGYEDTGSGLGGGIYIADTSPTLANLIISDNFAYASGGGIFVISNTTTNVDYSNLTLTNVTFANNKSGRGGGIYLQNANPVFSNVIFTGNIATNAAGGGINLQTLNSSDESNTPTLTDVTFSGNNAIGGGGLYLSNSSAVLNRITFSNNSADRRGGGMLLEASDGPTITNTTFSGNTSNNNGLDPRGGGGLMVINSSPTLNNVTFSENTSSANSITGGALRIVHDATISATLSNPVIRNSIFWGDNTTEITTDGTGTTTVSYSVVQGGYVGGTNIITTNPVLGSLASNGGLTQTRALGSGSSAIDSGNGATCATTDQRNVARTIGTCDIGAYEADYATPIVTTQAVTAIGTTTATGNGNVTTLGIPNPTNYGVVWDTAINPTIALTTKTAQGPLAVTGSFTSSITGLTIGTTYHVRAYATNASGTSYGADVTFTTLKLDQTISFTSTVPGAAKVGGATYTPTATATSGLTVALTIDASAASVCSISSGVVSFIGAGTCVINANQAGNANYNAAAQVQQSFSVGKGDQTVTFTSTAPGAAKVGGATYTATATATSGLTVALTIDASAASVCSISSGVVSFIGAGTCVINANQAGNANYNAAAQVQQSFSVGKGDQTVTFTSTAPGAAKVGGATYTATATATSGLTVALTIDASASSVCSISSGVVSFNGVGTCVINANQAGNANYNVAAQVQQSFSVGKGDQTVTFTSTAPGAAKVGGATYTATATATSGLTVALTIDASASSVCSISSGVVSFNGVGTCVINANQAGNANYNAAAQVQQSFSVGKGDQTVTFTSTVPGAAKFGGATYTPAATSTSGLTVALTIDASAASVCSISSGVVSFIGAGTCVINANQAGNANYNAAAQVQQSFSVGKGDQTVTFTSTAPGAAKVGGAMYTATATATSGLAVALTIDASASSVCSISSGVVSFNGVGTCVINANQAGNANYNAAAQVQQSFSVGKGDPILSVTNSLVVYDGAPHSATVISSVPGIVSNVLIGGTATRTNVGSYAVTANFVPTDTANYNTLSNAAAGNFVIVNTVITGNAGVGGATLNYYVDGTPKTVTADGSGNYIIPVTAGWSGTVTPSLATDAFCPASQTYANVTASRTGQNYAHDACRTFDPISKWTSAFDLSHGWTVASYVRTAGDVNNDGKDDLVGFGQDGVYVALSNGTSFDPISKWTSAFDLSHGWTVASYVRTVGDVNNDGRADLVGFGQDGVYVALSNGTSFDAISKWTSAFDLSHGWTVASYVRTVGDVNNDGRADLVGFGQDGVYVALSNGTSFGAISKWTSAFDLSHGWTVTDYVRTVGDVNNDGRADLIGFGQDGVYVALSNGTSFDAISKWTSAFDLSHGWTVKDYVRTVGDVNNDGRVDLIGFGQDGVYISLSMGTTFSLPSRRTTSFDLAHGWTVASYVRTVGDVSGDGKVDLVGFGLDGVYVVK